MKRIMTLILLTGLCTPLAWAARAPLTEPQLSRELQLLEEGFQPDRMFRLRIAALVASKEAYPPTCRGASCGCSAGPCLPSGTTSTVPWWTLPTRN